MTVEPSDRERRARSSEITADFLTGFDFPVTRQIQTAPAPSTSTTQVGGDENTSTVDETEEGRPEASAYPLYDNVYVLVPAHERLDPREAAELGLNAIPDDVDEFDLPARDRIYEVAAQFVRHHVRRLRSGSDIKVGDRSLSDRAIVISEKRFSRLPFRFAKLSWVIDHNAVFDVHGHNILCARLAKIEIPPRRLIWGPGTGDTFDLAYLLANVCAILNMHVPVPVAATGAVDLKTKQILGNDPIEAKRLAAQKSRIAHLILPFGARFMPGLHEGVRYWPACDVDQAVYSLFSAASSGEPA